MEDREVSREEFRLRIEESFTNRLAEAHKSFPNKFIKILLEEKGNLKEVKKRVVYLLFDTVFFLVADLIG